MIDSTGAPQDKSPLPLGLAFELEKEGEGDAISPCSMQRNCHPP